MWERWFKLAEHGTTVRTEVMAGFTTFAAMAYILAVNPGILAAGGMDFGAVFTATALASALMTAVMGLATNYPLAMAPGMGMNAFFTYTVCLGLEVPWPAALGMVFLSGALFLLLTFTGVRRRLIELLPRELKLAVSAGIGLFIVFIGLKNAGIIVPSPATLVSVGDLAAPPVLLALAGIVLMAVLVQRRVRGAIILGVLVLTCIGFWLPDAAGTGRVTARPDRWADLPASLGPTFLQLDLGFVWRDLGRLFPVVLAFLFVDVFDNLGTLVGVTQRAGLLDRQGNLPRLRRALSADAAAAMVGACLGTSTVTSYIESAAGVEEGGRTGLTALTVAGCFLAALFLHPLVRVIPAAATAPALVVVGIFMMQGLAELRLQDFATALPALLIIVLMPLTFSISEGLAIGYVVYVAFSAATGQARRIGGLGYALAALFLVHLLFGR